uniref:Uncharacterized protein n=1 Tax=Anguilla anguilla TaxID=7936 RepID=A0A0E9VX25_ANGAN
MGTCPNHSFRIGGSSTPGLGEPKVPLIFIF